MYELTPDLRAEIAALEGLSIAELRSRYAELFGEATRSKHRRYLVKRCIWGIQAREFGGLDTQTKERALAMARLSDIRLTPPETRAARQITVPVRSPASPATPQPGTVLVRPYKGTDIHVTIVGDGVEWNGVTYPSLSAVAKAITGTHCSGPAWFGLTRKTK